MSETIAFLGCSRGFGKEVLHLMDQNRSLKNSLLISRKQGPLESLSQNLQSPHQIFSIDFSKPDCVSQILSSLEAYPVKRLFYFAGGGPYGSFESKEWKDHLWSYQVNFLTPSHLLHYLLRDSRFSTVEQVVFVGSSVADHQGDLNAASYAAGKHALRGLVESILLESPSKDLRLFRPSYMDTSMLPPKALVRQNPEQIQSPAKMAEIFVSWCLDPKGSKILSI